MKLATSSSEAFIDDIKIKISQFFSKKLGKKQAYIIQEFNETILDIVNEDLLKKMEDPFEDKKINNN